MALELRHAPVCSWIPDAHQRVAQVAAGHAVGSKGCEAEGLATASPDLAPLAQGGPAPLLRDEVPELDGSVLEAAVDASARGGQAPDRAAVGRDHVGLLLLRRPSVPQPQVAIRAAYRQLPVAQRDHAVDGAALRLQERGLLACAQIPQHDHAVGAAARHLLRAEHGDGEDLAAAGAEGGGLLIKFDVPDTNNAILRAAGHPRVVDLLDAVQPAPTARQAGHLALLPFQVPDPEEAPVVARGEQAGADHRQAPDAAHVARKGLEASPLVGTRPSSLWLHSRPLGSHRGVGDGVRSHQVGVSKYIGSGGPRASDLH
mmetsp:Transcript_45878/g.109930  ORF Transcript_45878/g.109930 Transcript_45878/m.109930 type:complete len:315 (-) Transcript_45878:249-1193(-)